MNERTRSWLVVLICVVLATAGYVFFLRPFVSEEPQLDKVLYANSTWTVTMQVYKSTGPISAETYRVANDNGAVHMFFSATNKDGSVTKQFDVPLEGPSGTFLFEQLRADGIWDLDDKPVRPHSTEQYIIEVDQTLGDEGGSRAFGFSDPRYWATTKAQEIEVRLPAKSMKPFNLTQVASAAQPLRDPRYLKIVDEIRSFGPQSVLEAEALIRSELATMPTQQSAQRLLKHAAPKRAHRH
ncbi:MAG TPA: hypothetical protein VEJ41_00170 [Candidatus Acidoferrales bacterium]|nr:hypothetical protein [Candidatus Acidoferrales bacterium]